MKIGTSARSFDLSEEFFKNLSENKIDAIEISRRPGQYDCIDYEELSRLSKAYNIMLWSYHLPFTPRDESDVSSVDATVRERTMKYLGELIKKATDIGVEKFVIHPTSTEHDEARDERIKYAMESLGRLAELADTCGAIICVEDLPRTCIGNTSDEILKLISANDKLRVCLDTNHLMQETPMDFIKKVGNKIKTLHVSDYDFVNECHWIPGEGKINWHELYQALQGVGYDGVWMYEVGRQHLRDVIGRDLELPDFYKNANEIFNGEDLTVFSSSK